MVNKRKTMVYVLLLFFIFEYKQINREAGAMEMTKEKKVMAQIPPELDECFKQLEKKLTKDQLVEFKNSSENEIAKFHFSIGRWIRNNWQLWSADSSLGKFFNKRGITNPDDMSGIILVCFHRYLNNKYLDLEQLIKSSVDKKS